MAGLLGLLRQQRAGGAPPPEDEPRPAGFAARSEAVRALEHAVAAGSAGEPAHKKVAQGRAVPPGAEYVYDVDAHAPHEAQVALEVRRVRVWQASAGALAAQHVQQPHGHRGARARWRARERRTQPLSLGARTHSAPGWREHTEGLPCPPPPRPHLGVAHHDAALGV